MISIGKNTGVSGEIAPSLNMPHERPVCSWDVIPEARVQLLQGLLLAILSFFVLFYLMRAGRA
jgi:hypothetical protein